MSRGRRGASEALPLELFDAGLNAAADSVGEWAAPRPMPRLRPARLRPTRARALEAEVEGMRVTRDWSAASPAHLVTLYAYCHVRVYGVAAAEVADQWGAAVGAAQRLLRADFGGDPEEAVEFLRWTWQRERAREARRRQTGQEAGRIGWRLQFGRVLLTDWRVERARRGELP